MKKIALILPAYNAEKTLETFLARVPKNIFAEIILVDDCSNDKTYELACEQKGIKVYQTARNLGYGGNVKMCLSLALERGADIIIEIHPDGEYGFDAIEPSMGEIKKGAFFVLGNRFSAKEKTGMYLHKYIFSRLLTFFDNLILGTNIPDMHQGFRVYTRKLLKEINWSSNSNDYIFSFEIIAQAAFKKLKITSVPVSTYYYGKKRGASLKSSIIYSLKTFKVLTLFFLAKAGFKTKYLVFN